MHQILTDSKTHSSLLFIIIVSLFCLALSAQAVTITSPVGGENWFTSSTHSITWSGAGSTMTYLYYTTNNGTSWINIDHNSSGLTSPYTWTVPNSPSTSCKVWIKNEAATENGFSPTVFTINTAPIVLTAPVVVKTG